MSENMSEKRIRYIEEFEYPRLEGKYIITDPCYLIDHEDWGEFCNLLNDHDITCIEVDSRKYWVMSTRWGDGSYLVFLGGKKIGSFGVDSGLFCVGEVHEKTSCGSDGLYTFCNLRGTLSYVDGNAYLDGSLLADTGGDDLERDYAY